VSKRIAFAGDYYAFSNFSSHKVKIWEWEFWNGEAAFHAFKDSDPAYWERLSLCARPAEAKRLGRTCQLRGDWDEFRLTAMKMVVACKATQNRDVLTLLLGTGDAELVEDNYWHDQFWGNCTCDKHAAIPGENHLGRAWMDLRNYWRISL